MFKMKSKYRSNQYFERVRKFWSKVTFLFRMKYLKLKKKKNQEVVQISNTAQKNGMLHLKLENELNTLRIPRIIKENDLILDFFQFSICCQNFISNYPSILYKSDLLDIVQSNFSGKDNYRKLYCFAMLIDRRLSLSKPLLSAVDNNFSGKHVPKLRKIYITCMKDVDKYLKLLSCNYRNVNFSFGSKVLKPRLNEDFGQRWNVNDFFGRVSMLMYLASSNQSNTRLVKTWYPLENSFFDPASTNTLGNIRDRLRLENKVNLCNQSLEHVRLEYNSEQPILSGIESSIIDQKKCCIRLPSKFREKGRDRENMPKNTSSFKNTNFIPSETSRGIETRGKMKYNTCHTVIKIEKGSETMKDINYEWGADFMRSSYHMMSQASTQSECVTDTTIEYSNFPITKDFASADDSIVKKIINGRCITTNTCLNPVSKFSTTQTKDILAKTEKKRKFRTSLKLDNVERVFNLIEPRYKSLNPNCLINHQFSAANLSKRMRMVDNQKQSMVNKEASICVPKTTAGYQKSNMEVVKGQQTMNIDGKQIGANYQCRTGINENTSDLKPRDHALIMGGREKDINYRQTFVNCQVTSVDHKKIDIDNSEQNMDVIMNPSLTIIDEKKMTNVQKIVKGGEERNRMNLISNDGQLVNNNNDDGDTLYNNDEKNKKTAENLKILKSVQDMTMECPKTRMVDQESYRKYLTTVINDGETIKNGEVSIMNYKENHERSLLENLAKRGNNQRTVVDHPDSNLDARMGDQTETTNISECDYGTEIDHQKLNPNDYDRTVDYSESNLNNQGQPAIPSDRERTGEERKTNLIHKRKYTRKLYTKKMEGTKPQRTAKLKAVLLLKRVRRVR